MMSLLTLLLSVRFSLIGIEMRRMVIFQLAVFRLVTDSVAQSFDCHSLRHAALCRVLVKAKSLSWVAVPDSGCEVNNTTWCR